MQPPRILAILSRVTQPAPACTPWTRLARSRPRLIVAAFACALALASVAVVATSVRQVRPVDVQWTEPDGTLPAEGELRPQALRDLRGLHVASRALNLIRQHYVDPDKVHPRDMLEEGLQAVAHLVPEMLVDAPQLDARGRPLELRIRIGEASLRLPLADLTDALRLNWALLRAVRFVADHLPPDVPAAKVEYLAVNGMLSTLDQFSHMLEPDQWRDMQTNTGGNFGGLGIVILAQDGVLTIQSVIDASPAQKAGLLPGDQILQIDGEDTLNMTVDEAVERLRGQVGITARLQLKRKGWTRPQEVTVVRAVIHLQSVEAKVLDNGIGYARIKSFQRGTAEELSAAIDHLLSNGSQNGLVLDLRDNPGGLLDEAIRVGDLFIGQGPVVITVTGGQRQRDVRNVTGQGRFQKMPVAVLINGHSASASEVVAGALKYSGRAIVLGEQSFGKASVQVPYEIADAALKLTVAKYLVPGDINVMGVGIAPDIALQFVSATREQVSLFGGPHYSRAVRKVRTLMAAQLLDRAAGGNDGMQTDRPAYDLRVLLPEAAQGEGLEGPAEVMEREPRERAAILLRRAGDVRAAVTLKNAQADLAEMAHADDLALVAHLKKQGIDWRAGEREANPALRVQVAEKDGGMRVDAGDVLRMSVTLTNQGHTALSRLHILTRCDDPTLDGHEQLVGRLEPGQSRTVHLAVRISMRHGNLKVPLKVMAAQDGVVLAIRDETVIAVAGRTQPDFSFRFTVANAPVTQEAATQQATIQQPATGQAATGADDGVLQPGERGELRVEVRNRGPGASQSTVVSLRSLSGARLHLEEGRVRLGAIAPGGLAVARFPIRVVDRGRAAKGKPTGDTEPVRAELVVADEVLGVAREEQIEVPWSRLPLERLPAGLVKPLLVLRDQAARVWADAPTIAVSHLVGDGMPPLRQMESAGLGACHLELVGTALFDASAPKRRFATISVGGVKQAYQSGYGRTEVAFRAALRLDSGLNTVTIQAQAGPRRTAERQLFVHCSQDQAAAASLP